ncbi:hypothetical protein K2X92_03735 [Candidatus Gracilibacteria bacterium]|nr:hypothetical protein [Candidatus Gracilibacteria bacterium]
MTGEIIVTFFSGSLLSSDFSKNAGFDLSIPIVYLWIFIFLIIVGLIILIIFLLRFTKNYFSKSDIELNIELGGVGSVTVKKNYINSEIAHKIWTEIVTRKAGILIDKDHDILVEIYDSWYELFRITREVIANIPGKNLIDKNTDPLVSLLIKTLNSGLRPHLTKWQAKFRRWYEAQLLNNANNNKTPQEIQIEYPKFNELIDELNLVNVEMINYAKELKKLV